MYPLLVLLLLGQPLAQGQLIVQADGNIANIFLTGMVDMSGWEFRVEFDQDALEATEVLRGANWQDEGYLWYAGQYIQGAAGNPSPVGISGDIHIATIKFNILGAGSTLISLVDVLVADSSGNEIVPEIINGSLQLRSYPKPVPK